MHEAMAKPMSCHKIWLKLWNMQPLLGVCVGLWIILVNLPTAAAICEATPTIPAITGLTFGTLRHTTSSDATIPYVIVNPNDVVNGTNGGSGINYVAQVTFDFIGPPRRGAAMWLYVMDRNSTNQFTPAISYKIPNWAIRKEDAGYGIQTLSFGCNELPIRDGQYLAYGADALGGDCYQTNGGDELYIGANAAILASLGTRTYATSFGEGYAMSFVVRNTADDSNAPSSSSDTTTTYGTLHHYNANGFGAGYVVINEDLIVTPTCGLSGGVYVQRVVCDFIVAPQAGAAIWLYAMSRDGTTNDFTPTNSFLIPASLIQTGPAGLGIQRFLLNSTDFSLAPGQYIGIGFNSNGGTTYLVPDMGEYYVSQANAGFAGLSTETYLFNGAGGAACTFDVQAF